jgi:starch synthase
VVRAPRNVPVVGFRAPDSDHHVLKIAFVTPELQSLVRRTNLASVSESLCNALRDAGHDLRVFLPRTSLVDESALENVTYVGSVDVPDGIDGRATFEIRSGQVGGLVVYLLENEELFARRNPYGDENGPYADNWRRYAAFARAMLASLEPIGMEPDVIHCLDWTTGLIPVVHRIEYVDPDRDHPATHAGTFFAIHNLAIQGAFEREILPHIRIPHRYFKATGGLELGGKVNFLKSGAEFATIIGTHSASHAQKIQELDRGYGLESTFQSRKKELVGITNGIDYQAWNPENDPLLPSAFNAKDLGGKKKCKATLQSSLRLDNGPRTPLACTIGRWDADSGFDLVAENITQILERNIELIVMGSGQPDIHQRLKTIEESFIGRLRVLESYDANTAHLMMGGADILLLPSHYQPSNPLFAIAMRYGVAPLIYSASGLEDVVVDVLTDKRRGTGFHFSPYSSDGLMGCMNEFLKVYRDAAAWKRLATRCLNQDFSWSATAGEYLKAYRRVTRRVKARLAD